jgi:hypothetical protein
MRKGGKNSAFLRNLQGVGVNDETSVVDGGTIRTIGGEEFGGCRTVRMFKLSAGIRSSEHRQFFGGKLRT